MQFSSVCSFGSGVARVLRAPVQKHVMGPLVTKQLSNSLAAIGPAVD